MESGSIRAALFFMGTMRKRGKCCLCAGMGCRPSMTAPIFSIIYIRTPMRTMRAGCEDITAMVKVAAYCPKPVAGKGRQTWKNKKVKR